MSKPVKFEPSLKEERSQAAQIKIEQHLADVLERFRPELETKLFQHLPLWYVANYLCLKWQTAQPDWLEKINRKYITWTIVQEFLPASPDEKKSAVEFLKAYKGDAPKRGRHSKPGTAAGSILEDIRAFLAYKYAELVNDHHALGLTAQDLKLQISRFLNISDEALKDRRQRGKRYFKLPQTNSDAIIFRVDIRGIEKQLTGISK